jgi:Family of unknown function (DUF6220)
MRSAYRVLAFLVAGLVVVQAAAIAYAVAGLGKWVEDGNTFDKAAFESDDTTFDGIVGFMVHGINGMMLIPLVALLLLIVSFFAKVPGGVGRAAMVLGLVILQVALGLFGHEIPALGGLHGLNALILFGAAVMTGVRAKEPVVDATPYGAEPRTHV